ncbi:MAG: L,D-transpeptidase [Flavobacteriales bacterium]|nr:L,D-transpeptidase [Flavobacteriales bacterium]
MVQIILSFIMMFCSINDDIVEKVNQYCIDKKGTTCSEILFVSIRLQKLFHIENNSIIGEYPISSAKKGVGNQKNSDKTPLGLHSIKEKHGAETPLNGRMIGRIFYGHIATIYSDTTSSKTDDITSRILWLSGEEKGVNKGKNIDSYQRYIYIHGTSEEGKIGTPASHGCIRMTNKDVIKLFSLVKPNTKVLILE